jgi:hypothetical protein
MVEAVSSLRFRLAQTVGPFSAREKARCAGAAPTDEEVDGTGRKWTGLSPVSHVVTNFRTALAVEATLTGILMSHATPWMSFVALADAFSSHHHQQPFRSVTGCSLHAFLRERAGVFDLYTNDEVYYACSASRAREWSSPSLPLQGTPAPRVAKQLVALLPRDGRCVTLEELREAYIVHHGCPWWVAARAASSKMAVWLTNCPEWFDLTSVRHGTARLWCVSRAGVVPFVASLDPSAEIPTKVATWEADGKTVPPFHFGKPIVMPALISNARRFFSRCRHAQSL